MPAPASYVAGLGRGASGFTTRSDIGPAREGPSAEVIAEAQARRGEGAELEPEQFQDPEDEFGLLAGMAYEQDDVEADKIYEAVDEAMDSRRRARREGKEQIEMVKHRMEQPKIQQHFADVKRALSSVTDEEWENIPEVGNISRRKRQKLERSYAIPDSILIGAQSQNAYESSLDARQQQTGGFESGDLNPSLVDIGKARDKMLSLRLDQVSGTSTSPNAGTSIDPKDYLTSLDSGLNPIRNSTAFGDIKHSRMLFESLVKSNPTSAPGWIGYARLEEQAGKTVAARKIIKQGCQKCPKSEDVWLAAADLHNNDDAKVILANAVQHVKHSVNIWLAATELEHDLEAKQRVLRKAIEHIPNSLLLWKKIIELESSPADQRLLLARALEILPASVELWIDLARRETSLERAKAVMSQAKDAVPTSHEILIAAGCLMEDEAHLLREDTTFEDVTIMQKAIDAVDDVMEEGVKALRRNQVFLTRAQWLAEAEKCEAQGKVRTCEAIVKATVAMEVEEADRLETWMDDVESSIARGMVGTASAVLAYALKVFPEAKGLWIRAVELEKIHGTKESLSAILAKAVEHCPRAEVLWLMAAKGRWAAGDMQGAREVLEKAFKMNGESEEIWLAAVKLEAENDEPDVARELLKRARTVVDSERIWMKSAVLERQQERITDALLILDQAISKFPKFAKLYMIQGQLHQSQKHHLSARSAYTAGLKACPKEGTLWILASRLEEADGKSIKARALLEKARLINPGNDAIWAEAVAVEERSGGGDQARALLARGLQECPESGYLWALAIYAAPRPMRRNKAHDALTKSKDNPIVIVAVARLLGSERKIEKARALFQRAVINGLAGVMGERLVPADIGDSWGWWLKFERQHGTEQQREVVRNQCVSADPRHGPIWQLIAKDVRNVGKVTSDVLELVADALG